MFEVGVIEDAAVAEVSLDPVRARLLAALAEPGSATTLAAQAGLTRQKVNHHLRTLEAHGLIELVEERRKGNCTERVLRATAVVPTRMSPRSEPNCASRTRRLFGSLVSDGVRTR